MFVIAVVSQKGGSGKTTLSGHLSVQAGLSGIGPVAIVDTDPQGSLAAWWNERKAEMPVFVQTNLHDLHGHLENLRKAGVKLVVIDTPPAITSAIHEVIAVADYIVVPTKPSPHDLRAVGATVKLVQSCNKPMVFVLNDASPRAKITFEAAIALSQHGTVAPVTIHHRTLFASSMIDGRTAQELESKGQSATEIMGLWEYLNARLNSEILPTSIGLDASRRFDGQASQKQSIDPSSPVLPAQSSPPQSEEPDPHHASAPQTAASLSNPAQVAPVPALSPEPESVPESVNDLWAGFASENGAPNPAEHNNVRLDDADLHDFAPRPKVFGRRHGT